MSKSLASRVFRGRAYTPRYARVSMRRAPSQRIWSGPHAPHTPRYEMHAIGPAHVGLLASAILPHRWIPFRVFFLKNTSTIPTQLLTLELLWKLCTWKLCGSTSRFHSHTQFRVLSIITSQFWIDVWNLFSQILSNSSRSADRLKYYLTSRLTTTFRPTFML